LLIGSYRDHEVSERLDRVEAVLGEHKGRPFKPNDNVKLDYSGIMARR
jgi:hypothetical protein